MPTIRTLWISLLPFSMMGCALLGRKPELPVIGLAGIRLRDMRLFEQRCQLELRVQNPLAFGV